MFPLVILAKPESQCFCLCCCLFFSLHPPKNPVISTEAIHSLTVNRLSGELVLSEVEWNPLLDPCPIPAQKPLFLLTARSS